jgi:diacylglycerol O-acyltransferase
VFDGMGLINTIYSYGPEIAISFTSDRAIMPDPSAYAAALKTAFEELYEAKVKPKPASKAKAAAKDKAAPMKASPKAKTKAKPKARAVPRKRG